MSSQPYDGTAAPPGPPPTPEEDRVRRCLRDAVAVVEPSAWPADAVRERARRRLRNRRIATVLPMAAAVAACAVVTAAATHDRASVGPAATAPPGPTVPVVPTTQVVPPGRVIDIGNGGRMKLESAGRCLGFGDGAWNCGDAVSGPGGAGTSTSPVGGGSIGTRIRTGPNGTLYTPLYVGPRQPVRMTVTVEGHVYPVRMVTLPGHPGYTAGYLVTPPEPAAGAARRLTVTAYDARGNVLATTGPPAPAG